MRQGPIEVGEAVLTPGGNLAATHVIHAAVMGPDLKTDPETIARTTRAGPRAGRQAPPHVARAAGPRDRRRSGGRPGRRRGHARARVVAHLKAGEDDPRNAWSSSCTRTTPYRAFTDTLKRLGALQ